MEDGFYVNAGRRMVLEGAWKAEGEGRGEGKRAYPPR